MGISYSFAITSINSGTVLCSLVVWQFKPGSHQFSTFPIFAVPEPPLGRARLTHPGGSGQNSVVQSLNQFRTSSALNPDITSSTSVMVCPLTLHVLLKPCLHLQQFGPLPNLLDQPPTHLGHQPASNSLSQTLI